LLQVCVRPARLKGQEGKAAARWGAGGVAGHGGRAGRQGGSAAGVRVGRQGCERV